MKPLFSLALLGAVAALASCTKTDDILPVAQSTAPEVMSTTPKPVDDYVDPTTVYQFTLNNINGRPSSLKQFRGRKILIVNTASFCSYTPQYTDLQELNRLYGNKVVVLGFPSNDFGGQEPGSDGSISGFCTGTYGVTFPMFSKVDVIGATATPLYQFLGDRSRNGVTDSKPDWNFCKYLIDETGHVMAYYPSAVNPLDPALLQQIVGARASSVNTQ